MENIGYDGLTGLENIGADEKVVILYSEIFEKKLPEIVDKYKSKANIEMRKVSTGYKDALDFKLLAYGILLYKEGQKELVYVSRDKGYLSLKDAILELEIPINIRVGFAPDLLSIPIIYEFADGMCTRYELQHEKLMEYKNGEFIPIEYDIYKCIGKHKYISTKKKVPKVKEETAETAYESFIAEHGIVTEEMERAYIEGIKSESTKGEEGDIKKIEDDTKKIETAKTVITEEKVAEIEEQLNVVSKPTFTKSEKKKIAQQRWFNLMLEVSNWAEEHDKGVTAANAIMRMGNRHVMNRQEYMQVMGSILHEKAVTLEKSIGIMYDKHMSFGRKGKKK